MLFSISSLEFAQVQKIAPSLKSSRGRLCFQSDSSGDSFHLPGRGPASKPGLLTVVEICLPEPFLQNLRLPARTNQLHEEQREERHEQPIQVERHNQADPHHDNEDVDGISNPCIESVRDELFRLR